MKITRHGRWQVEDFSQHNEQPEAFENATNKSIELGRPVTITPPSYEVDAEAPVVEGFEGLPQSGSQGLSPSYSGNELFIATLTTAVGRNDTDFLTKFQANGFDYAKSQPVNSGAAGHVYTATGSEIANNPLGSALPSGRTNCLAMEALPYTYGTQTDFYVQLYSETDPVGTVPADVWFQFWIYHPDQLTGDTPVFSGHYWKDCTYIDANTVDVVGFWTDWYYAGREIRLQLSGSQPETTVSSVSFSGGNTRITLTDAIADGTVTQVEHKTNTKGFSEGKFLYATRSGSGWPASCANDGFVWIVGMNKNNLAGLNGIDPCEGGNTIACDESFLATSYAYTGCGNAVITTNDESNDLGNNLTGDVTIVPDEWTLVKIHIDTSGSNPNCSAGDLAHEMWIRRRTDSGFTKVSEWYGGVTQNGGDTVTLTPNFTDGMRAIIIPSTLGGANASKGNWYDSLMYMDDFCMCANEADLPTY